MALTLNISNFDKHHLHTALSHFKLDFEEVNPRTNQKYKVVFYPDDVLLNDDLRIVFEGSITLGGYAEAVGRVMYHKEFKTFQRVRYSMHTTRTSRIGNGLFLVSHPVVLEELLRVISELCEVTQPII